MKRTTKSRPQGRPTLLTPALQKKICAFMALTCASYETAAAHAGVSLTALDNWKARGLAGEEPYAGFVGALQKARAEGKAKALEHIALDPAWQAQAWRLERVHPKEFALAPKIIVENDLKSKMAKLKAAFAGDRPGLEKALKALTDDDGEGASEQ